MKWQRVLQCIVLSITVNTTCEIAVAFLIFNSAIVDCISSFFSFINLKLRVKIQLIHTRLKIFLYNDTASHTIGS